MRKKLEKSVGLLIGLSSLLPAAEITWQPSVDMFAGGNNEAFISTNGSFIAGFNGGTTAVTSTANGVTFTAVTFGDINTGITGVGGVGVSADFGNHAGPTTFGDGEFDGIDSISNLLNSAVYAGTSMTLTGLTEGQEYEMQILINDARGGGGAGIRDEEWEMGFSDGVNNLIGIDQIAAVASLTNRPFNDNTSPNLVGDYIIGTFVADATGTQTFSFVATRSGHNVGDVLTNVNGGQAQFNAFQLRSLPPDADGDGMSNAWEDANGLDRNDPSDAALDPDSDGLTNLREFQRGTDLNDDDSDDDNLLDGAEVDTHGTNPLDDDTDDDTLTDGAEIDTHSTNPLVADTDSDSLTDAEEVNDHSTDPNLADSDSDGINDGTEVLISGTDPNVDTSVPALDPNAVDLLAYWDFNNDANAAETTDLINNYVGTLNAGTTYTADALGHTEQAGDKAIYLGSAPNAGTGVTVALGEFFNLASINDQFSISFWQKLDAGEPTAATSSVGASRYGVDRAIMAHLPFTDGNIYFDHGGGSANRIAGTPISPVDWQQWNHITLVKDQDTKQVWINGSLALEGENLDAAVENNHHTILLGVDDFNRNLIGHVDDYAFYADPLNRTQILALANGTDPRGLDDVLLDTDEDEMPDSYENLYGLNPAVNDAADDLDTDGLTNLEEFNLGTLPNDNDTDNDNYLDGVETGTGIWESATDTGTDPFLADTDGDTLLDGVENPDLPYVDANQTGTSPLLTDTDADTYRDDAEIAFGSDPTDPNSWAINIPEVALYYDFNGNSLSRVEGAPDAALVGPAVLSANEGGFSGEIGDQSLDLGTTADAGSHAFVAAGTG
ncbi:hypothetical protein N9Z94_03230, partial [Akkermansiaceae bacterium]|nr:hypothetical protein [Akkermansiaceae bacterium]